MYIYLYKHIYIYIFISITKYYIQILLHTHNTAMLHYLHSAGKDLRSLQAPSSTFTCTRSGSSCLPILLAGSS